MANRRLELQPVRTAGRGMQEFVVGGMARRFDASRHRASRRDGWTLIEVVLTMTLFAIVMAAAAPALVAARTGVELRSAALGLVGVMMRARRGALAEGRSWQVRVRERRVDLIPSGVSGSSELLAGGARLAVATSGGDVRFFPDGLAENATFALELGGQRRSVIVNQRGRLRVE